MPPQMNGGCGAGSNCNENEKKQKASTSAEKKHLTTATTKSPKTKTKTRDSNTTNNFLSNYHKYLEEDPHCSSAKAAAKPPPTAELDPQDVLQASLDFERSFHAPPPPMQFETKTSSSSLYPALNSFSKMGCADDDMEVEKNWEAASKSSLLRKKSSQACGNDHNVARMPESSPALSTVASIPSQNNNNSYSYFQMIPPARPPRKFHKRTESFNEDEIINMKLEAYEGRSATPRSVQNTSPSMPSSSAHHAHAQATVVECDVHPSEIPHNAVHAELVEVNHATPCPQRAPAPVAVASPSPLSAQTFQSYLETSARGSLYSNEATVIGVRQAEAEQVNIDGGWNTIPPPQAMVIEQSGGSDASPFDRKPPATNISPPASPHAVGVVDSSVEPDQQAQATVVGYSVHPAEMTASAVQAEYMGHDFHAPVEEAVQSPQIPAAQASEVSEPSGTALEVNGEAASIDDVAEATVIESGPAEKATAEAWSAAPAEEAQVLHDANGDDSAAASLNPSSSTKDFETVAAAAAAAGEVAEVVGIRENVHPLELQERNTAEAELIGSDPNCAVAIATSDLPTSSMGVEEGFVEEAEVVDERSHVYPPVQQEARATLISSNQYAIMNDQGSATQHATAVHENLPDREGVVVSAQQATPITVVASENHSTSSSATPVTVLATDNNSVSSSGYQVKIQSMWNNNDAQSSICSPSVSQSDLRDACAQPRNSGSVLHQNTEAPWMSAPSCVTSNSLPPLSPRDLPPPIVPATATPMSDGNYGEVTATPINDGIQSDVTATAVNQRSLSDGALEPPIPMPASVVVTTSTTSRASGNSIRSEMSNITADNGLQRLSTNIARGTNNVMEILFGNPKPCIRRRQAFGFDTDAVASSILPRTLLPSSVIFSEPTNSWVATVNTNQKALEGNNVDESSKALRAFSVPTKKQALALARAWSPPRMHPFSSNPSCFVCESQFAVFRRACHCRNCGVCICSGCSVQWPSKMVPDTYNIKKESAVNICKACDWLCSAFRLALLDGDHDKAVALYSTGNLNLTTPFANVKGELFYPVHCAVLGGNLTLLKWLVDEHCCPLRSIRISNGKQRDSAGSYTPILTSKGRSLLGIALSNRNVGMVRYLVVQKRMLLSAEKGLSVDTLVQNLDLVLRVLPEEVLGEQSLDQSDRLSSGYHEMDSTILAVKTTRDVGDDGSTGSHHDECIICFANDIDCVATPCGHQICCLECSAHISRCPVCSVECSFMRVFRP